MDEPGFFSQSRMLFIGLGLMGGSLALALKGKTSWMGGVDPSSLALKQASQLNIFDSLSSSLDDLIAQANVIILAAPVRQNIKILKSLSSPAPHPTMIMDLSSTKRTVLAAMQTLPANYDPIGGHPMCGSEKSSILYANPHFFENARFIITPLARTSSLAIQYAHALAAEIKANALLLEADRHDQIAADISHFPYLLSSALCLATPAESKLLISTGFGSTARLAGSSPAMMFDILTSNRDNVLNSMTSFKEKLAEFETALRDNDENKLKELINQSYSKYQQLIN
jgi:prephenate dehydrogenase